MFIPPTMYNPRSTYRIQFHANFTLGHLERIIPYLQKLGVGSIYASPVFDAVPGSMHGYDVVNPHRINPEIGTERQLREVAKKLKDAGIGWIQDIVPNHMAYDPHNLWLMDVLEKGRYSPYARFFDLPWSSDLFQGRVLAPFLGESLEEALANGSLRISYHASRLNVQYHDNYFPLHPRSYERILQLRPPLAAITQILSQVVALHQIDDAVPYTLRWHEVVLQLDALMKQEVTENFITDCIDTVNADTQLLRAVLDEQVYSLAPWQTTASRITFRRFFTVNGLIGLNMQDEKVFDHYHTLIATLLADGVFDGLRVDHIDGLYDPGDYVRRLRALTGPETYIIVEKILHADEALPAWPLQGTSGYEFLAYVNQLLTYAPAEKAFDELYRNYTGEHRPLEEMLAEKKSTILFEHMGGELDNLCRLFIKLNLVAEDTWQTVSAGSFKECLADWMIHFPVYRFYANKFPLPHVEAAAIEEMMDGVRLRRPDLSDALALLSTALLGTRAAQDAEYAERVAEFYMRCMQFTGPLMAKGMEDTLMYTFNRFIAHNEVGDSPAGFGMSPAAFHQRMVERQATFPLCLNGTSTHDTKRSEDVRARLQVVATQPDAWSKVVHAWTAASGPPIAPDANDRYYLFQTLAGAWPLQNEATFAERMDQFVEKMLRESKRRSDWAHPDESYEESTKVFVRSFVNDAATRGTLDEWVRKHETAARLQSLVQVLLKFTCPGVPDVYQGCETWDYSLVDPDNRRPVDYRAREQALDALTSMNSMAAVWTQTPDDAKLYLVQQLMHVRREASDVWADAAYVPLTVEGRHGDSVLAFARKGATAWFVVVVPLHAGLDNGAACTAAFWKDTTVSLPDGAPAAFYNLFTHERGEHEGTLKLETLFSKIPMALLRLELAEKKRHAGILMHITSLPAPFAIGDIGPAAYRFADLLARCGQTYWQMLPIHPTRPASHSPYSAYAAMAANPLLISPELLVNDGLLSPGDIAPYRKTPAVDYVAATEQKRALLDKASEAFSHGKDHAGMAAYKAFVQREDYWLADFALYEALAAEFGPAWRKWPEQYRRRVPEALRDYAAQHSESLERIRWQQYIFDRQWRQLRAYCRSRGIALMGDVPFYICLDAVDVWAHPEIFGVDSNGETAHVAGVPPDYFNADGQLWGMPVFDWAALSRRGYDWWIQRLRKDLACFDYLRLDHFRAFASYWQVPVGEKTAVNGEWKEGPGEAFMKAVQQVFSSMPLVAEDLGDITADVYALRDAFGLAGMKVLQFAVDASMPRSPYAPHNFEGDNFVVYTGTHDNNTTRGWFRTELDSPRRNILEAYAGCGVDETNVSATMMRLAFSSTARLAIVPFQDVLNLGEEARLNVPGVADGNWQWRWNGDITASAERQLRALTILYNR